MARRNDKLSDIDDYESVGGPVPRKTLRGVTQKDY